MTCAGRASERERDLPVSARTRRTSSAGKVPAITPRLMWSLRRTPAGRPAGGQAIAVALGGERQHGPAASLCEPYWDYPGLFTMVGPARRTTFSCRAVARPRAGRRAGTVRPVR